MQVKTSEFKTVLKYVEKCLQPNGFVPILSHICFQKNIVFAYNGIEAITVNYETGLNCAVPGDLLCKLVKSIKTEVIDIIQDEANIIVKTGKLTTRLAILQQEFIYKPSIPSTTAEKITIGTDFIQGIKKCLLTVNSDPSKINQHGISVINNCLYSTDVFRISKYVLEDDLKLKDKLFLPINFCVLLSSVFDSVCDLYISDNNITCIFNGITIYTEKILGVTFLDFEKMLSICKVNETEYQDVPVEMSQILDRCQLFVAGQNEKIIGITIGDKFLEFDATGKEGNHVEDCASHIVSTIGRFRIDVNFLSSLISNVSKIGFVKLPKIVAVSGTDGKYLQLLSSLYLT